ncbi:hypothetical protein COW53_03515 [bacterium CG17_big_fil_post_rev_8_21_14_2_50_64_8]|nr:MAG: hypothetical protein COW53_03515 [bacterium CG17_big_fil_post_rev_8_21_14_2_50_64_8]PJA75368.1 MAG: hypothetical protein CO151_06645 [bacterium CG_4_9_14_3_um_filter_65_15]
MMRFLSRISVRTVAWWLVPVGLLLWAPVESLGSREFKNGYEDHSGDPIDGNDFSSGGSGGSDVNFIRDFSGQPKSSTGSTSVFVLPSMLSGTRIMVIPSYDTGVFWVRFLVVDDGASSVEMDHVE